MASPSTKTEAVDAPLHAIGFQIDELSPQKVTGHLHVTQKACQVCMIDIHFSSFRLTFVI